MKIGVLAVQGAFTEHEQMLCKLGAKCVELRRDSDIKDIDGLVLPGGESTVQSKLLRQLGMYAPLKEKISAGLPVLATCAGLILLAKEIANENTICFGTLPVRVRRNAYGRQLGSFQTTGQVKEFGDYRMIFIRAPYIETAKENVEILAQVNGRIVAVRYQHQLGMAFHPEMGSDDRIHRSFLEMINKC